MLELGLSLWTMQSTAAAPATPAKLYGDLIEDARAAERLGFHSLWVSEHHFWYDGWCPSPLVACGAALGATSRLRLGTGIHIAPLHDPARTADAAVALHDLSEGRFELGVGLGYREAEYDGFGLSVKRRGRLMDAALDLLGERWSGAPDRRGPRVWVGGVTPVALGRAARRGLSVLLPQTVRNDGIARLLAELREEAAAHDCSLDRVGVIRHAWLTDGSEAGAEAARERIVASSREYQGAWWKLEGKPAFAAPELLDGQMRRATETALIGSPRQLQSELRELEAAGVDLAVLQIYPNPVDGYREQMTALAGSLLLWPAGAPS